MIELSNRSTQELQPGQAISFDNVILSSGCHSVCHNRQLPNSVKLCRNAVYKIQFSGNITGASETPIQLAVAVGGSPLSYTAMNSTPSAANALNNVSTSTFFKVCCCDLDRISIVNSGSNVLTVAQNSNLSIKLVDNK